MTPEFAERLEAVCDGDREAHALRNPTRLFDLVFSELAHLEIELDPVLANHPALVSYAGTIRDDAFPVLLEAVRAAAREEFGPLADRPSELP